jgi:putative membrane protein
MLGSWVACWSSWQYKRVVKALKPVEIPEGYSINSGPVVNVLTAVLGVLLMAYLAII